ncbi:hypothetical protein BD410DRAFT_810566, partial [Rickenella mellea]
MCGGWVATAGYIVSLTDVLRSFHRYTQIRATKSIENLADFEACIAAGVKSLGRLRDAGIVCDRAVVVCGVHKSQRRGGMTNEDHITLDYYRKEISAGAAGYQMVKTQSSHHVVETELIVDHQRPKDYHSMLRLLSLIQPSVAGFGMLVNRSKNDRTSAIIHSLPNEILLEIFRECIPKTAQDRSIRNASQAPLLLGRVCRLWRLLSLSSSALWSNLTIVWTEDDRKKDLKATKVWLLRSESHPLTIHVDVARARCHSPRFSKVLVLVAAQASRWKEISIARLPHQYHNILLAPLSMAVGFPYLESFHVQILTDIFFEPGLVPEVIDVSFDLSSAPRLLEFTHYGGWGFHLDFRTQIHTMRSLRIVYEAPLGMPYSLEELLSVLIQCTSLEELLLPIRKDPSSNHPAQRHLIPIVTLPNLHELTLIMDRGTHPGYIVERLSVPELTTLDIRFDTYVDEEDVDQDLTEWPHLLPLLERPHLI